MFSSDSSSEQYLTLGLRVNPQSPGWYESLTKVLKNIKGAAYTVDGEQGMALVPGSANSKSILMKPRKSGSDVVWIETGKPNTYGSRGCYETDPYLQYPYQYGQQPGYHYSSYHDPYVPNPPHFEPYSSWSTRYY
ncbi:uncharacterized protein LOC111275628 [Durio zibethinus]|uniref:Uncharacterized protein LOC111275628 n=1 Tax=Durio zibethinus TaxID=66656 RepID=A0A6P5WLM6_DURZI|nr:uncharacterized protein LOC111275628 [Durio zibethinus]